MYEFVPFLLGRAAYVYLSLFLFPFPFPFLFLFGGLHFFGSKVDFVVGKKKALLAR